VSSRLRKFLKNKILGQKMKKNFNFRGLATALVTPFDYSGEVDYLTLRNLINWQIENGVDAIVPVGTTGESATLSEEEQYKIIETAVEVSNGRIKIIAGAGSNSTAKAIKLAKNAQKAGADAILSITPYYNKPTQEGLYAHFAEIANAVDLPIIMYNVPGRTGVNMSAETTLKIAEKIPNIVGIKESSGNIIQVMQIIRNRPDGFKVYSGDDSFAFPIILAGGDGVISVASNEVPNLMKELVSACLNDEIEKARELHYKLLPLMEINFIETNPIPVKSAMAMLGLIKEVYRLPLVKISDKNREKIRAVLLELKLEPVA
jgi:4-hydroxy-tetrahydrodipicolinate synthase